MGMRLWNDLCPTSGWMPGRDACVCVLKDMQEMSAATLLRKVQNWNWPRGAARVEEMHKLLCILRIDRAAIRTSGRLLLPQ